MACSKSKKHAAGFLESCGALTPNDGFTPQYRCDLKPHTTGKHHCCGGDWVKEW